MWVDADHAGDIITRKSTSGMVIMFGQHCLKSSSSVQTTIRLSSGESEYYACVKGSCHGLGVKALLQDWGFNLRLSVKIKTDSSTDKGTCGRRGLGKQCHISIKYLWLQDKVTAGDIQVEKVHTKEQRADFLTKAFTSLELRRSISKLNLYTGTGRSPSQKKALMNTNRDAKG